MNTNKKIRYCCVCGTTYHYCPSCGEDAGKPTWMFAFDNENCKTICEILSAYGMKDLSKEEAKTKLDKCDLSRKDNYATNTKAQLREIYGEDFVKNDVEVKVPDSIVKTQSMDDMVTDAIASIEKAKTVNEYAKKKTFSKKK